MTDLQLPVQCTAAEYWQQKLVANLSVLLSHWWHRMLFLLQHHRLLLKDFSVCGLLTKGTRNRMEKSLYMSVDKSEL